MRLPRSKSQIRSPRVPRFSCYGLNESIATAMPLSEKQKRGPWRVTSAARSISALRLLMTSGTHRGTLLCLWKLWRGGQLGALYSFEYSENEMLHYSAVFVNHLRMETRYPQAPSSHSPITYVHPSLPIHTSCLRFASTSIRAPGPNVSFFGSLSSGYRTVNSPFSIRWVVTPACVWGG